MGDEEGLVWRGIDARLERIEDIVRELDELLRGSRKTKYTGLVADQERMELELRKLNAVVFVDSTGKRGIAHDIDVLMDRRSYSERREGIKWTFWGLILATVISSLTAILTNLDKLKSLMPLLRLSPLELKIERAKHPKSPKKLVRYRTVPRKAPASPENPPSDPIKDSSQN